MRDARAPSRRTGAGEAVGNRLRLKAMTVAVVMAGLPPTGDFPDDRFAALRESLLGRVRPVSDPIALPDTGRTHVDDV